MNYIQKYQSAFLAHLDNYVKERHPKNLYDPVNYILMLGGKRLRPVLTLLAADCFEIDYTKALDAALSVEVFHNFSLVHDDIMDDAPLRRGKETVHEKWDINTGILSGDVMLIMAYQLFENYKAETFQSLAKLFSKTATEVCEGQQYDVDFETRNDVTIPEYLKMIEYKTAVLVGAAMQMGAIVAEAKVEDQEAIYDFGRYLGIAFQLQDDYLDAFGNPETFGKQVGGDIIENKKTYLYLKALEFASEQDKIQLLELFNTQPVDIPEKVDEVKRIFTATGAKAATKEAVEQYTEKAFSLLKLLNISEDKKKVLKQFGLGLMTRNV
ncbi:polyprenyl synthetase [Winogradskyella sp. PC-19]|uniref:polyprenyl synthetase family protein n=1 Tax=unclassified Winogradskyella TaxID=2615021 RepID=UPI000B3CD081|nr:MULTISPECIES: polyprenyl synthetase family protein [unclassified Winogradskyella]ARV09943.1 polyprenyl synthetase [Winogradskyella sp. PC-19]RZN84384.1 MAG: polyprenyl synthetase family protein [Winogradskyella sp.]